MTLSARMKKLSREYGWAAVGVYFALSVLDFPFCFLAVRMIGVDKIGETE
jgi:N-terminal acetyltransferase 2